MNQENNPYIVVFRYTEQAGGYCGVMTMRHFSSKEAFDSWYVPEISAKEEIVEEGVTKDRAIRLASETPLSCRMAAAKQEATDSNGNVDPDILRAAEQKAMFANMQGLKYILGL
jgi:hypothetical protein